MARLTLLGLLPRIALLPAFLMVMFISGCSSPQTTSPTSRATRPVRAAKWYEGGTLHRRSVAEWNAAGYKNRFATSADFVATLRKGKFSAMSEMRAKAIEMEVCISEAAKAEREAKEIRTMKVSELAAACAVLMGYR